jgi:hypothetical protein
MFFLCTFKFFSYKISSFYLPLSFFLYLLYWDPTMLFLSPCRQLIFKFFYILLYRFCPCFISFSYVFSFLVMSTILYTRKSPFFVFSSTIFGYYLSQYRPSSVPLLLFSLSSLLSLNVAKMNIFTPYFFANTTFSPSFRLFFR